MRSGDPVAATRPPDGERWPTRGFARPDGRSTGRTRSRRRCAACGALFQPVRPHQRFDRTSCRKAAFVERHQPRAAALPLFAEDGR